MTSYMYTHMHCTLFLHTFWMVSTCSMYAFQSISVSVDRGSAYTVITVCAIVNGPTIHACKTPTWHAFHYQHGKKKLSHKQYQCYQRGCSFVCGICDRMQPSLYAALLFLHGAAPCGHHGDNLCIVYVLITTNITTTFSMYIWQNHSHHAAQHQPHALFPLYG